MVHIKRKNLSKKMKEWSLRGRKKERLNFHGSMNLCNFLKKRHAMKKSWLRDANVLIVLMCMSLISSQSYSLMT